MQMNEVESVPLEACAEVEFRPGRRHVMLIDVRKDFQISDEIEVTLHFRNSEDIQVLAAVREAAVPEGNHSPEEHFYGNFSADGFVNREKELEKMRKLLVLFTLFALVVAACSNAAQAGGNQNESGNQTEIERNLEKWRDANISHYRYHLSITCFCIFSQDMPLLIEVMDGKIVSMEYQSGKEIDAANLELFNKFSTIDRIFAEVEAGLAGAADEIRVTYDETYGFPVDITFDYVKEATDDELYLTVSNFEPLP